MNRMREVHAARMRARATERLRVTLWRKLNKQRAAGVLSIDEVDQLKRDFWARQESAVNLIREAEIPRATPRRRSA